MEKYTNFPIENTRGWIPGWIKNGVTEHVIDSMELNQETNLIFPTQQEAENWVVENIFKKDEEYVSSLRKN